MAHGVKGGPKRGPKWGYPEWGSNFMSKKGVKKGVFGGPRMDIFRFWALWPIVQRPFSEEPKYTYVLIGNPDLVGKKVILAIFNICPFWGFWTGTP